MGAGRARVTAPVVVGTGLNGCWRSSPRVDGSSLDEEKDMESLVTCLMVG